MPDRGSPTPITRAAPRRGPVGASVTTFELSRMMGTSLEMIEAPYGHLAEGRLDVIRSLLAGRSDADRTSAGGESVAEEA